MRKRLIKFSDSNSASSEDAKISQNSCMICVEPIIDKTLRGKLPCDHSEFCWSCILDWARITNKCPLCNSRFSILKQCSGDSSLVFNIISVSDKDQAKECDLGDLEIVCENCRNGEDEDQLLLCDSCDRGYHIYCIGLAHIPELESWFCVRCIRKQSKTIQKTQKEAEEAACVYNSLPYKRRRLRQISDI